MIKRNPQLEKLNSSYLFPEIQQRVRSYLAKNPEAQLISLGIGDTTEPLPGNVAEALAKVGAGLGTAEGYVGYGPEQGISLLRRQVASEIYKGLVTPEETFISDGAGCDLGRLQVLFGGNVRVAIQDPAYPVYVDGSIIQGVDSIHMMPCSAENGFFPDLSSVPPVDLIYFCSPNNPTGTTCTRAQLEELVAFAKANRSIILFDTAYAAYIQDPSLPQTIYEIEGAKEVAIEIGSFSKLAGFTGVRLGWTVVPEALKYSNGLSVRDDWNRIVTTLFNGASIIAQHGGLAVLSAIGQEEVKKRVSFYLENAALLKGALEESGYEVYGGTHSPYLWVRFPGQSSWQAFQQVLEKAQLITVPGAGFGPAGEGFLRFSAYAKRENILQAIARLQVIRLKCHDFKKKPPLCLDATL